ncbi:KEOPS complex subunit Cgi121 [Salinarchaeum chitinilyticum]
MRLVEGYADVDDLNVFLDSLAEIGDDHDCVVQAFDARLVAGEGHLEQALATARRATERGEAIARDPAVEVLCYAAGTRQIDVALELGVRGRTPVVVLVAAPFDAERSARAGEANEHDSADEAGAADAVRTLIEPAALKRGVELADPERLRSFFEIDDAELAASDAVLDDEAALATLVRERVALLTVER